MISNKFFNMTILFSVFTAITVSLANSSINFNSCIKFNGKSQDFCQVYKQHKNTTIEKRQILDEGVMLWYNQPSAICKNGYLYYSYLGLDKNVKIGKFGKNTKQFKSIFSYPKLDDHGAPSIWVIQNGKEKGKIISFYSLHSSEMYFSKSKQKENIEEWEDVKVFDNRRTTYNSIGETSDGKIFVFYTVQSSNNRSYVYRVSVDGANTWSAPKELINFGADEYIYAAPVLI